MNSTKALSSAPLVASASDEFMHIADALHKRLNAASIQTGNSPADTTDLYGLLVDEYGLRTRAAILRNASALHRVENAALDQAELMSILQSVVAEIPQTTHLPVLRSLIAGATTLCVSISPGKGVVVDFLAKKLEEEIGAAQSRKM